MKKVFIFLLSLFSVIVLISQNPCPGIPTVTDYDGNTYNTVLIGNQCWMKENLKSTHDAAGNNSFRTCYNDEPDTCDVYGGLYSWNLFMNGAASSNSVPSGVQGICPTGWHIPSHAEWDIVVNYLGGSNVAGGGMKEAGTFHWNSPNIGATNSSGFTALPGGYISMYNHNFLLGDYGYFWSSTEGNSYDALYWRVEKNSTGGVIDIHSKYTKRSVRCVNNSYPFVYLPILQTDSLTGITQNAVLGVSEILDSGGDSITSRGLCWNTIGSPTLADSFVVAGSGIGTFTAQISNLLPGSTYYVRAFATNSVGTAYGNEVQFTTLPDTTITFTCGNQISDIDGNTYNTVLIGSQCWMKENLKATHYSNGTSIPYVPNATDWYNIYLNYLINNSASPAYCFYDNDSSNINTYGNLYNWAAIMNGELSSNIVPSGVQGVCPTDWHVPSDEEWKILEGEVDSQFDYPDAEWDATGNRGSDAGKNLKAINGWINNGSGIDLYNFNALPGGYRVTYGSFFDLGFVGNWGSSTESASGYAYLRSLNTTDFIGRISNEKDDAISVRCLHNSVFQSTLNINMNKTDVNCYGNANGEIDIYVSGGTAPYSYIWSNGETTEDILNLTSGWYFVTVSDANNNSIVDSCLIEEPAEIVNYVSAQICENESYLFGNQNLSIAGVYNDTLISSNACDSIIVLDLTVNPVYDIVESFTICEGDVYPWQGNNYTTTGTYYANYQTTNGCDSNFTLNLTVNPVYDVVESFTICEGDVYTWQGNNYTTTGTYYANYQTVNGCDSNYTLNLSVNPVYDVIENQSVCDGETYFWQGNYYSSSGTYYSNFATVSGCDSTFTLNLTVNQLPNLSSIITDVSTIGGNDGSIDISVSGGTAPYSYLWNTGATIANLSSLSAGNYSITVTDANGCMQTETFEVGEPSSNSLNWTYTLTGFDHTILIPLSANITINGYPVQIGDYIGVFYTDDNGELACGGYQVYSGSNTSLAAWGDDSQTTEKDGFASGENFKWKIWSATDGIDYPAAATYMQSFSHQGQFEINGISGIASLTASLSHVIPLPLGWNMISTYVDPFEALMDSIFSDISINVELVKNANGDVYWPAWSINLIGNHIVGQGYQLKMNQTDTLIVTGMQVIPEQTPISLAAGWNMIGYLRQNAASIVTMLQSIESDIEIVKNNTGNVYWPAWSINLIGDMLPGQGYKIRMYNTNTLTYPANSINYSKSSIQSQKSNYHHKIKNTGSNMSLMIPMTSWEIKPEIGSDILIYSESGLLVGAGIFSGAHIAITIWGDDNTTSETDGLAEGEEYSLIIKSGNSEQRIYVNNWIEGDGSYKRDKTAVAGELAILNSQFSITQLYQNKPNPFSLETEFGFYLPERTKVKFYIMNLLGETVETILSEELDSGEHKLEYKTKHLAPGTYYYKLKTTDFEATKKMVIVK